MTRFKNSTSSIWVAVSLVVLTALNGGCALLTPAPALASGTDAQTARHAAALEAALAMSEGHYARAIETLEPLASRGDAPPELLEEMAEAYLGAGEIDKAERTLRRAMESYPRYVPARRLMAGIHIRRKEFDKAIGELEAALEIVPKQTDILEELGLLRLKTVWENESLSGPDSPMSQLIDVYERLAAAHQGGARIPALVILSSLYSRIGEHEKAIAKAQEAVDLRIRNLRAQEALARAYYNADRKSEALEAYRQALLIDPKNYGIRKRVAELIADEGVEGGVLKFYEELAGSFPRVKEIQEVYGSELVRAKRWKKAAEHYESMLNVWPSDADVRETLVRVHLQLGEKDKALASARDLLAAHPDSLDGLLETARRLRGEGQADSAAALLGLIAEVGSFGPRVQIDLAQTQIELGRRDEAIATLERVLERQPDYFAAVVLLGGLYAEADRHEDAQALYDRALPGASPEHTADLKLFKAELYRQVGKNEQALAVLEDILENENTMPELTLRMYAALIAEQKQYARGHKAIADYIARLSVGEGNEAEIVKARILDARLYRDQGEEEKTVEILEGVLSDGGSVGLDVVQTLVELYVESGDYAKGHEAIEVYLQQADGGEVMPAMSLKAWVFWNEEKYEQTAEILEQLHAEEPTNFGYIEFLADAYAAMGDFEKALGLVQASEVLLGEEHGDDLLMLRARLYHRQGRNDAAVEAVETLVSRNPDDFQTLQEAGVYYYESGRMKEAERVLRRAMELNPEDPEIYNTLGYFFAESGIKLDEAEQLIRKALEMRPDAGHIHDSLGWLYYQRGEIDKAIEALEEAIERMGPKPDPVVLDHLGDAYARDGRIEEARKIYSRALEHGADEKVREKLEALK